MKISMDKKYRTVAGGLTPCEASNYMKEALKDESERS